MSNLRKPRMFISSSVFMLADLGPTELNTRLDLRESMLLIMRQCVFATIWKQRWRFSPKQDNTCLSYKQGLSLGACHTMANIGSNFQTYTGVSRVGQVSPNEDYLPYVLN